MKLFKRLLLLTVFLTRSHLLAAADQPIAWDAMTKDYNAKPGELIARFFFVATNTSSSEVVVDHVKPSCGCTSAKMPSEPWRLGPAQSGRMDISVDLRGKRGLLTKSVAVFSTAGKEDLILNINIPDPGTNTVDGRMSERAWNQEVAKLDRQAVFKQSCVQCHFEPTFAKSGAPLYDVACGICHDAPHRASMVPAMGSLKKDLGEDYWRNMVAHGKPGTLMPAFAAEEGGPLDKGQIESLVQYLLQKYPAPGKAKTLTEDAP